MKILAAITLLFCLLMSIGEIQLMFKNSSVNVGYVVTLLMSAGGVIFSTSYLLSC